MLGGSLFGDGVDGGVQRQACRQVTGWVPGCCMLIGLAAAMRPIRLSCAPLQALVADSGDRRHGEWPAEIEDLHPARPAFSLLKTARRLDRCASYVGRRIVRQ